MSTLEELVKVYNRNHSRNEDWKLSDFRNRSKSLEELIVDAVWGKMPRVDRDKHQFRVPKSTLDEMAKLLSDPSIVQEMEKCKSFDDIFTIVYESRVRKFGPLAVYDTSLRIGAIFRHYPENVYLHQGALEGANELLGEDVVAMHAKYFCNDPAYPYIYQNILPDPLSGMAPYHIENFLCINKKKFAAIRQSV